MENDLILHPIVWNIPKPREAFLVTRDFMIIRASCAWAIQVKPDAKPNWNTGRSSSSRASKHPVENQKKVSYVIFSRSAKMFFSWVLTISMVFTCASYLKIMLLLIYCAYKEESLKGRGGEGIINNFSTLLGFVLGLLPLPISQTNSPISHIFLANKDELSQLLSERERNWVAGGWFGRRETFTIRCVVTFELKWKDGGEFPILRSKYY